MDPNAFSHEVSMPLASMLACIAFWFVVLSFVPFLQRGMWKIMKIQDNGYYLSKWEERCNGPFGEVMEWFSGINPDGTLKP
ncbi:MAG: hypothetical protein V7695_06175 [Sulfitobacter sp.]